MESNSGKTDDVCDLLLPKSFEGVDTSMANLDGNIESVDGSTSNRGMDLQMTDLTMNMVCVVGASSNIWSKSMASIDSAFKDIVTLCAKSCS
ncbi:hypothetical protein Tco_0833104 [Tanacetum coccineum]